MATAVARRRVLALHAPVVAVVDAPVAPLAEVALAAGREAGIVAMAAVADQPRPRRARSARKFAPAGQ